MPSHKTLKISNELNNKLTFTLISTTCVLVRACPALVARNLEGLGTNRIFRLVKLRAKPLTKRQFICTPDAQKRGDEYNLALVMKNFRHAYLKTLGFTGTRQEDSLGPLLSERILDRVKLKTTWLHFDMPSRYRSTVWKIFLGTNKSAHSNVRRTTFFTRQLEVYRGR
jgi:hypothetical protein